MYSGNYCITHNNTSSLTFQTDEAYLNFDIFNDVCVRITFYDTHQQICEDWCLIEELPQLINALNKFYNENKIQSTAPKS